MRPFRLFMICAALLLFVPTAMAQFDQTRRTGDLADRLGDQTRDLADRSYSAYTNNRRNSRSDAEALFQDQQLNASAELFRRLVRDRRSRAELQDATVVLSELARRADRYGRQRALVSDIQLTIADIQRDLNFGGGGPGLPGDGGGGGALHGSMRWRGTVDDNVFIQIQGDSIEQRTIAGSEYNNATYNFTSPLPRRNSNVRVNKIRGRGSVRVIQQPSRDNSYTAIIQVLDPNRGPNDYELEVSW